MQPQKEPTPGDGSPMGEALADDKHFLKTLVELGDAMPMVATEAIHDADGAKVVDVGRLIDSRLYSALAGRLLAKPLDASVAVESPARAEDLWVEAQRALADERFYRMLGQEAEDREALRAAFEKMELPSRMSLRLTMAKERMPALFAGCARRALVCAYLARMMRWPEARVAAAAAVGAALDLGMLHVDPELLGAPKRLTGAERRHVFAHPLIGMICAKEAGMADAQCEAIAQHHERLDGGGYPMGLAAESLSLLSRVAQLASAAVGMLERSRGQKCAQLHLALRLNSFHYDPTLIRLLMEPIEQALAEEGGEGPSPPRPEDAAPSRRRQLAVARLEGAIELVDHWKDSVDDGAGAARAVESTPFHAVDQRMAAFIQSLADAGVCSGQLSLLGGEGEGCSEREIDELERLAAEASWQISSIAHEAARRWPKWGADAPSAAARDWLDAVDAHVKGAGSPRASAAAAQG